MGFSQPSTGGDKFEPRDYNGRLLIVYPKSFSAETPSIHGVGPSADCDIIVVDQIDQTTGMPLFFTNARLFGNLAKSVSRDLGGQVLGRLGQVPTQRGNPAWVLQNFTDQDVALATPADNAYKANQFKATEAPPAPAPAPPPQQQWQGAPAPAQYGAPAAAPAPQAAPQYAPPPQQQQAPVQQYQQPAPAAPPAPAQYAPPSAPAPAAQQWQQPAPAAPAPVDPALLQRLAAFGINPPPGTPQAELEAIAATLPQ